MARIRLRLLGGLEIFDPSNQSITLSVKKAKALLVYLAVQPHICFSRDHLAEFFWPNATNDRARHSLRQAIADLRKHLPAMDQIITVQHNDLQANESNLSVDILNFERLAKLQDPHAHNEAYVYYGGRFLDAFNIRSAPFTAWCEEISQAAHEQYINVVESLSEHNLLEGNTKSAIELCQQLVKIDPVRESAHRNLMSLYVKQDDTDAAIEQYVDCCRKLKKHLNTEPETQTKNLYSRIKKQIHLKNESVIQNDTVRANTKENIKNSIPECIGRESEMSIICSCIEHTCATKQGQSVFINGDNGIGKSYYLAQAAEFAQQLKMNMAKTRFFNVDSSNENGIRDLILDITKIPLMRDNIELPGCIANKYFQNHPKYTLYLATLYSILDFQIPKRILPIYTALKPVTRDILTTTVIVELISQIASLSPLFITLDDCQYLTENMRLIIQALIELTAKFPIILVYVTNQKQDSTIDTITDVPITSIKLTPLSREHVFKLYPDSQSSQSIDLLYLNWLQLLPQDTGTQPPANLADILRRLISTMSKEDKRALDIATVLGIRFSIEVLNTLLDNPQYLPENLIQQGYLLKSGNMLEFSHQLTQQALYLLLDKKQRCKIHIKAASYYLFGNTHLHAYHLDTAGSTDTAKAYLSAALSASNDFKPDLAIHFYDKALEHAQDDQEKYFSTIHKGELLLETDRIALAVQSYDHAQKYAADQQQQTLAWLGMAIGLIDRQQFIAARSLLERCETILTTTSDHETLAKLYYYLAKTVYQLNSPDAAIRYCKIAFEYARQAESSYWQAKVTLSLGEIEFTQLNLIKAYSELDYALRLSQEHRHDDLEIQILTILAKVKLFQADFQGSTKDLEQVMNKASLIEAHQQILEILCVLCILDFYKNQFSHLQQHTELAAELCKLVRESDKNNHIASYQLLAAYHTGNLELRQQLIKEIHQNIAPGKVTSSYVVAPIMALTESDNNAALSYLINAKKTVSSLKGSDALECCFLSIEAAIHHQLWDIASDFSDTIILLIKDERLPFFIMCAERVRILSQIAQDTMTENTRTELVDIFVSAKHFGLEIHLPAYEMALNQLRDPIQV